jgi:formylglycine-generating enzyme required for sulfatase activity
MLRGGRTKGWDQESPITPTVTHSCQRGGQKFLDKLSPDDTAAIYFSGHGVEVEGLNFLLPRDIPNISYGRQEQLKRESLSVSELLLDLRKRKPKVTLVILDACRDNPLMPPESRSLAWGRGLARMDAPAGTFIMYSAGVGETALDRLPGDDPDKVNSIYTRKLLPLMKTTGLPLHELARQLRLEVYGIAATVPHTQQPAYYDGLIGKFCLAGCGNSGLPAFPASTSPAQQAPVQQSPAPTYFKCTMKGGVMDGKVYSFSIDAARKKAGWAEYGVPLEIVYLDDLRINTNANIRVSGWPDHDHISFNFNRLTLVVQGALARHPSADESAKCIANLTKGWSAPAYCNDPLLVGEFSGGTCEVITRPEDAAHMTPKLTQCHGIETTVGNERRCLEPKDSFRDCPTCPEMVVAPAGRFAMGSPESEPWRELEPWQKGTESPQHEVKIARPFAVGRFATTLGEFATFIKATGHSMDGGCEIWTGADWKDHSDNSWRSPGFPQDDRHPVVCVNWHDAKAFVAWLSKTTGKSYRLLSDAEREYVTRAGTVTPFWWGDGHSITLQDANYDGSANLYTGVVTKGEYRHQTVPVDSFKANPWGLYNVHGNVHEWTEDCWHKTYHFAPTDGSAWTTACADNATSRVMRGGFWGDALPFLRSAYRLGALANLRFSSQGFRVARTL